jgi:hypothetical protein
MKKLLVILLMLVAINANAQWVQMSNGMPNITTYSLAAIGNNIFAGTSGIYKSTNNGLNWEITSLSNRVIWSFAFIENYIIAGTDVHGIYVSSDNGSNWTQTVATNQSFNSLLTSGNIVFAGSTNNGVYISNNNGLNWTQTSMTDKWVVSLAANGNIIFAGTVNSGVYFTTNNGTNWAQTSLNNKSIRSLTTIGNNIFAGTDASGVYLSTNNGTTWAQTALDNRTVWALTNNGTNVFAGTYQYGVYSSTDNGSSWFQKNQGYGSSPSIFALLVANNYVFSGTAGLSIWRRPLSEIIGIQNISTETPSSYSLSQNYPNPFNPMCNVQFSMYKAGNVKLVVYDVQGREVQTLVNEKLSAGTYEVKFDGSMLNSGVYFYKLSTDGFTETKKMLMIK